MDLKQKRAMEALNRELLLITKQEKRLEQAALKARAVTWKTELERLIPPKVNTGLQSAFCKGFALVFDQGRAIIEKGYNKENIRDDHTIRDFAVQLKGGRKELKKMYQGAKTARLANMAFTTVEGIGLGALGIGLPDVVLFVGNLLKGIYETALHYGFDYDTKQEQLFILKMMETSLSTGDRWVQKNAEVNQLLFYGKADVSEQAFQRQMQDTSDAFAVDMLLLKFIQGLPVVGILGGAANPVYYNKVMKYVQLKYRKRYLLKQKSRIQA